MARTADEYKEQLKALLPPGRLWDALREQGTVADGLFGAMAEEFARIDQRADDLLAEADPRTTIELLTGWEGWAGLPDTCTGDLDTLQERHNALVSKLTTTGGQSREYFIELAAALGYEITISEFDPFTCESPCTDPLCDDDWRFVWRVNAPETTIIEFTCESPCTEPLRSWGNKPLECAIREVLHAHRYVMFGYGG